MNPVDRGSDSEIHPRDLSASFADDGAPSPSRRATLPLCRWFLGRLNCEVEADGDRCLPRSSKPLSGTGYGIRGGFDSHALPPNSRLARVWRNRMGESAVQARPKGAIARATPMRFRQTRRLFGVIASENQQGAKGRDYTKRPPCASAQLRRPFGAIASENQQGRRANGRDCTSDS